MTLRSSPITSSALASAWPLIGREDELEHIAQARADASCNGIVVSSEAGIGKSRLAREAFAAAGDDGALTAWVQATGSSAAVPLGAFAGLIPDDVRSDDPLELMRRSVDALRERAGGRPVVLGVDDAQLLDPVSAALVLHVAVSGSAFVIATVRSGERVPDAIVSLWKDAGAWRLELEPLDDAAVEMLVEAALGDPVEQGALRWLCDSSRGNALYVRELVLGAVDDGTFTRGRGLWRMASRPSVSRPLVELVAERLAGLTDDERAPLELLGLGEPLRVDEVIGLSSYESLAAAESRGMIVIAGPASDADVRLAHPLYGEVMNSGLPELRARAMRVSLAGTIQARDPLEPDDALRVARWLLDAGETVPVTLLVDAARAANLSGDPDLAAQLAELAVADRGGVDEILVLGRAHVLRKRFADAEAVLSVVEDLDCTPDVALEYVEQRAMQVLYWGLGRPEAARALLVRAQMWWPDPAWQQRLMPLRLTLASLIDGWAGTVQTSEELLAAPDLDPGVRRQLETQHAAALFYTGRAREAHELVRSIRPPIPPLQRTDTLALGLSFVIGVESGEDWGELDAWMSKALRDGVRAGDHVAPGISALSLACMRVLEGRYADATRWLAEAELHLEHNDVLGCLAIARAHQVGIAQATADPAGAAAALERVHAALGGRAPLPSQLPYTARAEGWAALARGDAGAAQRCFLDGAAALADAPGYAAQLTYEALRAGAAASTLLEAQERLAERCDGRLVRTYAAHTAARAARDGEALMAVADEMAAIGALRYGLEAAVDAAAEFLAAGRQDSARRAATRARELHDPAQGTEPPMVDGLDSVAIELTRREAQVAALAGRGLTNAEIADQLVLSVRTVETHVYRAMQKRGVSDRRDL